MIQGFQNQGMQNLALARENYKPSQDFCQEYDCQDKQRHTFTTHQVSTQVYMNYSFGKK